MSRDLKSTRMSPEICLSSRDYFTEIVGDAFTNRRIKTYPLVQDYLVDLLNHYLNADNLFDEVDTSGRRVRQTLAETFLRAANSEPATRIELMKKLADRSLYISGFFGDSLQRKTVDIDYYAEMGGAAYASLAGVVREDVMAKVYNEFSTRFLEFADVLMYISSRAQLQNEENILRLFETYARTGSDLAREKLHAKGLIAVPLTKNNIKKQ